MNTADSGAGMVDTEVSDERIVSRSTRRSRTKKRRNVNSDNSQNELEKLVGSQCKVKWGSEYFPGSVLEVDTKNQELLVAYNDGEIDWEPINGVLIYADDSSDINNEASEHRKYSNQKSDQSSSHESKNTFKSCGKQSSKKSQDRWTHDSDESLLSSLRFLFYSKDFSEESHISWFEVRNRCGLSCSPFGCAERAEQLLCKPDTFLSKNIWNNREKVIRIWKKYIGDWDRVAEESEINIDFCKALLSRCDCTLPWCKSLVQKGLPSGILPCDGQKVFFDEELLKSEKDMTEYLTLMLRPTAGKCTSLLFLAWHFVPESFVIELNQSDCVMNNPSGIGWASKVNLNSLGCSQYRVSHASVANANLHDENASVRISSSAPHDSAIRAGDRVLRKHSLKATHGIQGRVKNILEDQRDFLICYSDGEEEVVTDIRLLRCISEEKDPQIHRPCEKEIERELVVVKHLSQFLSNENDFSANANPLNVFCRSERPSVAQLCVPEKVTESEDGNMATIDFERLERLQQLLHLRKLRAQQKQDLETLCRHPNRIALLKTDLLILGKAFASRHRPFDDALFLYYYYKRKMSISRLFFPGPVLGWFRRAASALQSIDKKFLQAAKDGVSYKQRIYRFNFFRSELLASSSSLIRCLSLWKSGTLATGDTTDQSTYHHLLYGQLFAR